MNAAAVSALVPLLTGVLQLFYRVNIVLLFVCLSRKIYLIEINVDDVSWQETWQSDTTSTGKCFSQVFS